MSWSKIEKYLKPGNLVKFDTDELGIILPDEETGTIRVCGDGNSSRAWYTEEGLRDRCNSIEKIWGPAPNRYGVSFDTEHRSLLYSISTFEVDVCERKKVFVGTSNKASSNDISRVLQIIKKEGKVAVFWDTNKSSIANHEILAKCHELVLVTPEGFRSGDYIGKGLDEMIRTALNDRIRIRVLVENKLRKYDRTEWKYPETESFVNYSLLFVL